MIRLEGGAPGRIRVIGSLQSSALKLLFEATSDGPASLDLSGVDQADEDAVTVLAALVPQRCTLVGCPRWLALWLDQVRQRGGQSR